MPSVDRCIFNATSTGTVDFAVLTAVQGYQTPASAGAINGAVYSYAAQSADLTQWEVGQGAYTSGTTTLARTTVLFNSLGTTAKVNFVNPPQVMVSALAEDLGLVFQIVSAGNTPAIQLVNTTESAGSILNGVFKTTTGGLSRHILLRSRGSSIGGHAAVAQPDALGAIDFNADDGTNFINVCEIVAVVDGTVSAAHVPCELEFFATDAAGNQIEIAQMGGVTGAGGFNSLVSFGYGVTGAGVGGAVTQTGSRTTSVTVNTICGAITMFSAAGSATAATFTVSNSKVVATDTIILNQKSGTNLYNLLVTAVASTSFNITFFTTGGTATDSPVINFSVIKAAAS